ncbi:DUF2948 family protein [Emcibacteraceae bacterium]|jgi:hypothetical protein|uniref:DUF2948 family protein n=1 Tax=Pseudemcibacter sp. TaxID=2943293 RepID=UPI0023219113|nr:DUF2948 family protein [Kordiimonadaceae bacterium]MDA9770531.1 DUF2948 family protein [Emcibacteraceae bacterium]MDG1020318.1 DUF2948 family protein [Emcibacteraceae bacterium]MDG1726612.1 DUF2948 family protein [Emcibacteraceae bacterium]
MAKGLKLKAEDQEDLTIISAYLQDAVTVVGDFTFSEKERLFAMMVNRYQWEEQKKMGDCVDGQCCQRIRAGCHFANVLSVSAQNIPQKNKKHVLELLAIEPLELENGNVAIDLIFAADAVIRLETELIDASMQDVGEPYPAKCHPKHQVLDNLSD